MKLKHIVSIFLVFVPVLCYAEDMSFAEENCFSTYVSAEEASGNAVDGTLEHNLDEAKKFVNEARSNLSKTVDEALECSCDLAHMYAKEALVHVYEAHSSIENITKHLKRVHASANQAARAAIKCDE
ncbi:MAG: hypothetical protein ACJAVV_003973 [Alphaproteobacteria bacterium]|jgi:hypothetical protein